MNELARALESTDDFLVAAHVNPDGDAIGSTAALGYILRKLGKRFTLYNRSGLPDDFDWLRLPAPLQTELPDVTPGLTIILDSGALDRVGEELATSVDTDALAVVDHHLGNPGYGSINWVDKSYSSVGEMIGVLARELDIPLAGALGECIYLALVTDTGHFSYGSTSPRCLRMAADIVEAGLDPGTFNAKLSYTWTMERIDLVSRALAAIELFHGGKVGCVELPRRLFEQTGTDKSDSDSIINFVRAIRSVKIAIALREEENDTIKFSLRSTGPVNVQQIAHYFGGGGHRNAAGGTFDCCLEEAKKRLLAACEAAV
jgi:phosphoesterase RecJ-like protein